MSVRLSVQAEHVRDLGREDHCGDLGVVIGWVRVDPVRTQQDAQTFPLWSVSSVGAYVEVGGGDGIRTHDTGFSPV